MKVYEKKNTKSGIFYLFFEIGARCQYIIFSIFSTFLCAYLYSFELIYLFVRPFFAAKDFIFLDLTEALSITFQICSFFTFFLVMPYLLYQIWSTTIPSFLMGERRKINFFIFSSLGLFLGSSLIFYFFFLPECCNFLFTFQIKKELLNIQLKPRIYSYVGFTVYFYSLFLFFFQLPLFILFLFEYNLFTPYTLSEYRRYFLLSSLFLGAFISPPDFGGQLFLSFFFIIFYEKSIWLGLIYKKKSTYYSY